MALRRDVCSRFIREPGYRFVELPDPERLAPLAGQAGYREAVSDWHTARAKVWAKAIDTELGPDGVGAFLAWGDRRWTTARCASSTLSRPRSTSMSTSFRVSPRCRRSRLAPHPAQRDRRTGLVTTGRQLRVRGMSGSAVGSVIVLLDAECAFQACPANTRIWWGAYLGTDHELLVAGTIGEVGPQIEQLRAEARAQHGWIMDTYLLRPG